MRGLLFAAAAGLIAVGAVVPSADAQVLPPYYPYSYYYTPYYTPYAAPPAYYNYYYPYAVPAPPAAYAPGYYPSSTVPKLLGGPRAP